MLKGKKVILREIQEEDLETLLRWRNSPDTLPYVRTYRPLTMLNQEEYFKKISFDLSMIMFLICLPVENVEIGYCGLQNINWKERSAEVSILIEKKYREKGYGEDALRLLLDYGFKNLGIHRIWAEIWEYAKHSVSLFEKVGFKNEGRLRDVHFWDGKYYDSLIYSILESEHV